MDFDAAIEINRKELLRIVGDWLLVTAIFHTDKRLPPRLSRWVSMLLYKIEKAAYFLIIAHAKRLGIHGVSIDLTQLRTFPRHSRLTIQMVQRRLCAVQSTLLELSQAARRFTKQNLRKSLVKFLAAYALMPPPKDIKSHQSSVSDFCGSIVYQFKAHPP